MIILICIESADHNRSIIRARCNEFTSVVNRNLIHGHHMRWVLVRVDIDGCVNGVALMIQQMNGTPMRSNAQKLHQHTETNERKW